jgi:hypothetical protein
MPVLMNKGDDPRRAAWLFYTDRETLDDWGRTIVEGRWDSARLVVDADEVAAAKKASSLVEVWAQAKALIPEDFDLEAAKGEVMSHAEAALERARMEAEEAAEAAEADEAADQDVATDQDEIEADQDELEADPFDYEPVPAPEGLRVRVGTTTRQAAQSYLMPHESAEGDGAAAEGRDAPASDTDLPGLQMLAQLIDYMRESGDGLPAHTAWYIDASGILRMVRAKKVKVVAGNVLSLKS